jgi:vacuolar-type H+-ATPase subunit E/Vma4
MALQDILNKILETAAQEVRDINLSLETEQKKLSEKIKKLEMAEFADFNLKSKEVLALVSIKTDSMARRENKRRLLEAKRRLIEKSLNVFLRSLEKADDELYAKILDKLFEKVDVKNGTIFVPENRVDITTKKVSKNFIVKSDASILGGFIIKNKQVTIDNTFKNLVKSEFKNELEIYFANQLKLS